jgi:hypothetical protein
MFRRSGFRDYHQPHLRIDAPVRAKGIPYLKKRWLRNG